MAYTSSTSAPGSGGGGGGLDITGWVDDAQVQLTNFTAGTVSIALPQTPISENGIAVDYNGQKLRKDVGWSYNGGTNSIDILFGDPYVTDYDTPPYFQFQFPY